MVVVEEMKKIVSVVAKYGGFVMIVGESTKTLDLVKSMSLKIRIISRSSGIFNS